MDGWTEIATVGQTTVKGCTRDRKKEANTRECVRGKCVCVCVGVCVCVCVCVCDMEGNAINLQPRLKTRFERNPSHTCCYRQSSETGSKTVSAFLETIPTSSTTQ